MNQRNTTRVPATSLQRSIEQTIQSGRLGTIVSLRVLMSAGGQPVEQLGNWLEWGAKLFGCAGRKLFASRDASGRQLSVLCSMFSGATISLTAVTYSSSEEEPANTLQLLLIGQHGSARLQGGDEIDPTLSTMSESSSKWKSAIENSVQSRMAVEVK